MAGPALFAGLALLLLAVLTGCGKQVTVVGILEDNLSPRVDAVRNGFLEPMTAAGFKAGDNTRYIRYNAESRKQGLDELAVDLVTKEKAKLILAMSPDGLKAASAAGAPTGIPVVFAMEGPNAAAGGRQAMEQWKNVTGVAAPGPEGDIVALVRRVVPVATRLAVLFDPADTAGRASASQVQAAATRAGLTPLMTTYDAKLGKTAALGAIDQGARAFYLAPGKTLEAALPAIMEVANAGSIPVFAAQEELPDQGVLVAVQVDWKDGGQRAGDLAARVLKGAAPASLPAVEGTARHLVINQQAARRLRVIVPQDILAAASRVIE